LDQYVRLSPASDSLFGGAVRGFADDLDSICAWGAASVVTLLPSEEFAILDLSYIAQQTTRRRRVIPDAGQTGIASSRISAPAVTAE